MFDKHKKPARWGFDKGLVEPQWNGLWRVATAVVPFWESTAGDADVLLPRELVSGNRLTVEGTTKTWKAGRQGPLVDFAAESDNYIVGKEADIAPRGTHGSYFLIHRKVDTTRRTAAAFGVIGSSRLTLSIPFTNQYIMDWGGFSGPQRAVSSISAENDNTDIKNWGVTAGPSGIKLYLNGVELATNDGTAASRTVGTDDFYLNQGISSIDGDLAEYLFFAAFDAELTPAEMKQLHDDPYGLIRRRDNVIPFVAPAVGGASLLLMNRYIANYAGIR